MTIAAIVGSGQDRYILTTNDYSILAWGSVDDALAYFEDGYMESHGRSYESSMSACIHAMTFQPVIVTLPDSIEELKGLIGEIKLFSLGSISGRMSGIKLPVALADDLISKGQQVRLVKEIESGV